MQWVEPAVSLQVRFVEWTAEGQLRHAAFVGVRRTRSAAIRFRVQSTGIPARLRQFHELQLLPAKFMLFLHGPFSRRRPLLLARCGGRTSATRRPRWRLYEFFKRFVELARATVTEAANKHW